MQAAGPLLAGAGDRVEGRRRSIGQATEPSPHEIGAQRYRERYGSLVAEAARWRVVAVLSVLMVLVLLAGFVHLSGKSGVQPYVIEVDEHGAAVAMGLAQANAPGGDLVVRSAVGRFILNLRTISPDVVALGYTLTIAYAMAAEGSAALRAVQGWDHKLGANPKRHPVHVKVTSIERQGSSDDYRVNFIETHKSREGSSRRRLTAYLKAKASTRKFFDSSAQLIWNPSRVYVTSFSITDHGTVDAGPQGPKGATQ